VAKEPQTFKRRRLEESEAREHTVYITKKKPSQEVLYLGVYLILLGVSAYTRDFGLYQRVYNTAGPYAAAFVEPLWKAVFWLAPIALYITFVERQPVLEYLKFNKHIGKGVLWGFAGSLVFCLKLGSALLYRMPLHLHYSFNEWLNGVILVGIIEEIIFRGFLFQQFELLLRDHQQEVVEDEMPVEVEEEVTLRTFVADWVVYWAYRCIPSRSVFLAATLSTALFVAIHFPVWILLHAPLWIIITTSLVNVILGYLSCALLRLSGSLWSSILLHTLNDLFLLLFP
jgi:uncharacterized protein